MVKWLPVIAAGLIFLSGCAPVVKENGKTMPRIDGEAKIEWNREKYPLAVDILPVRDAHSRNDTILYPKS